MDVESINQLIRLSKEPGKVSDRHHTFDELYEFRKLYNALLFNEWASSGKYSVMKSLRHSDGTKCFGGGWFIVMAELPTGQISNHYKLEDWNLFDCDIISYQPQFDGHTPQDVLIRLKDLIDVKDRE